MSSARIDALVKRTVERYHLMFDTYGIENVWCQISGGKDSTIIMECGALAARERSERLRVHFYDEEAIPAATVAYVGRVAARADIDLSWYCVPIACGNCFSRDNPTWWPWASEARAVWTRQPPDVPSAVLDHPYLPADPPKARISLLDSNRYIAHRRGFGSFAVVMGMRMIESPARRATLRYWMLPETRANGYGVGRVINDWSTAEVWGAIRERGWDWNRYYLSLWRIHEKRQNLRVGPLFGEQSGMRLAGIRKIDPELFGKIGPRIPGGEAIARYSNTAILGRGKMVGKPTMQMIKDAIAGHPPANQIPLRETLRTTLSASMRAGIDPPMDMLFKMATRGDSRGDRFKVAIASWCLMHARKELRFNRGRLEKRRLENTVEARLKARREAK